MDEPLDPLDPLDVRVLGALIEKHFTTPGNYPLTLNALTAACNQTTNREPVMELSESDVSRSLVSLERRSFVRPVHRGDARVKRWRHLMPERLNLHPAEIAVLCIRMLRDAQTPGEIRARTARFVELPDPGLLDITLDALMTLPTPLIARLPRRPGQKESRYAHLLSGAPSEDADAGDAEDANDGDVAAAAPGAVTPRSATHAPGVPGAPQTTGSPRAPGATAGAPRVV